MREILFILAMIFFLSAGAAALLQKTIQATKWLKPIVLLWSAGLVCLCAGLLLR